VSVGSDGVGYLSKPLFIYHGDVEGDPSVVYFFMPFPTSLGLVEDKGLVSPGLVSNFVGVEEEVEVHEFANGALFPTTLLHAGNQAVFCDTHFVEGKVFILYDSAFRRLGVPGWEKGEAWIWLRDGERLRFEGDGVGCCFLAASWCEVPKFDVVEGSQLSERVFGGPGLSDRGHDCAIVELWEVFSLSDDG
jgi:hypothetical protein